MALLVNGTAARGTTSLSVPYPSNVGDIKQGDLLVLCVVNKYPANSSPTLNSSSNWSGSTTFTAQVQGGAGAAGADTGNVYTTIWTTTALGSETGNVTVTISDGNAALGYICSIQAGNSSTTMSVGTVLTGSDSTGGGTFSVASSTASPPGTPDYFIFCGINGDNRTWSTPTITQTGTTYNNISIPVQETAADGDDLTSLVIRGTAGTTTDESAIITVGATGSGGGQTGGAGSAIFLKVSEQLKNQFPFIQPQSLKITAVLADFQVKSNATAVVITPSRGDATDPTLTFQTQKGTAKVTLTALPTNNGTLAIQNASGANIWTITQDIVTITGNLGNFQTITANTFSGNGTGFQYTLPIADDFQIEYPDLIAWTGFKKELDYGVIGGKLFNTEITSTFSLAFTSTLAYGGGILSRDNEIHFIPSNANRGQKITIDNNRTTTSTYSLVFTGGQQRGGVLAPNGDIHFVPYTTAVGQKVNSSGIVSTYSILSTSGNALDGAYWGGAVLPLGEIHFVPFSATVGQKISITGSVSTYNLVYTVGRAYVGGVLDPEGDLHFVPYNAVVGQRISGGGGAPSTYSLVYTVANAYQGGVLAQNGDIHFVPYAAAVGQKVDINGVVSTYSLISTTSIGAYLGGVLAPNGDIHFIPFGITIGQKVSASGIVSTYSVNSSGYHGGVLAPAGDIYCIPFSASQGQIIHVNSGRIFYDVMCAAPWLNHL